MKKFLKKYEELGNFDRISDALRKDIEYERHEDIEMNGRKVAMRIIRYLFKLKEIVQDQYDMNYGLGEECILHIAKENGVELSLDDLEIQLENLVPVIDEKINGALNVMGYNDADKAFFEEYFS